ncbi:MAG: D-alanine--poly(phosphoribitol) ligase subunit 2 [Verrucomicrobiales bacterium]|nr:D-alanine--poly(phosphoribitol) ligase subunit 2 [Verrucomicrobiales bacterium]
MTVQTKTASIPDLTETIIQIFADHLAIDIDDIELDLIDEGLLDSLAVVDLLLQLEKQLGFTVVMEELDLEDLRTVRRIEALVLRDKE